jgi:hypothetical protein
LPILKISKQISIKDSGNNIVAIIDTNGKVLSGNKEVANLVKFLMDAPLLKRPIESKTIVGTQHFSPSDEDTLEQQLLKSLPFYGYKL